MKKKIAPVIDMEAIHRDYNFLGEFVHVQETMEDGIINWSCTLFDRLEATLWDMLDKEGKEKFELHVNGLKELIEQGINDLTRKANEAYKR